MNTETELRRLVELAAKALGIRGTAVELWAGGPIRLIVGETDNDTVIDLLGDDGDSARMRSALGIGVNFVCSPTSNRISGVRCFADRIGHYMQMHEHVERVAEHNNDHNAALRLCALKVAAMIGEGME